MHLQTVVTKRHVEEAHRLFKISTMNAASSGLSSHSGEVPQELQGIVRRIEEAIKRRVAIGTRISYPKLQSELLGRFNNDRAIESAIIAMVKRDEF